MARKLPKGQVNRTNAQTIKALTQLMKDIDQKYSIKVGIIGENGQKKQEGSTLTNAELGAIHEFGCTIKVTEKMRAYLHYNGLHLKPDTETIVIPTRSFLRMPLLSGEFKDFVMTECELYDRQDFERIKLGNDVPLHTEKYRRKYQKILEEREAREQTLDIAKLRSERIPNYVEGVANWIASEALFRVKLAFENGGYGKWAPITEYTKSNRKHDKGSPPLTDSGELKNSITMEVKRSK